MSQSPPIHSRNFEYVREQCEPDTPECVVNAIATQLDRGENARTRIETEGEVVRDMRGSVIPHPAVAVERDAVKLYTSLMERHRYRGE